MTPFVLVAACAAMRLPPPAADGHHGVQGTDRLWMMRNADARKQARNPAAPVVRSNGNGGAVALSGAAGYHSVQGGDPTWAVRDSDARKQLRDPNAPAPASAAPVPVAPAASTPVAPVARSNGNGGAVALSGAAGYHGVQGGDPTWAVRDSDARKLLRDPNAPAPAPAPAAPVPVAADAPAPAAPVTPVARYNGNGGAVALSGAAGYHGVQGGDPTWAVRDSDARKRMRQGR